MRHEMSHMYAGIEGVSVAGGLRHVMSLHPRMIAGLPVAYSRGMFMTDINDEVKQYGSEGNVVFRKTKDNYSNPRQDGAAALSTRPASGEPALDTNMTNPEIYTVEFSSKAGLDMVVRGLKDLQALFEMRVNEAKKAGDASHADTAATELKVVMEALSTLHSASTL